MSRARDLSTGKFSGTLEAPDLSDGTLTVGTEYLTNGSAKAWVNFNGTGTIAARDSLNLSSLTDNGTGLYRVGHTSAFATANYAVVTGASRNNGIGPVAQELTPRSLTTTQYDVHADYNNGTYVDFENCFSSVFGDLA